LTYLWSKETESKNVRIILVGIANGVDRESLRRLLRNVQ
jgi:V/A-type H+-transporting ATPase subunit C